MSRRISSIVTVCAALLFVPPATALAADTYVDAQSGNDSNPCTAQGAPCLTIQTGINKAGVGDDVFVDGGTYAQALSLQNGKSLIAQEFAGAPDGPPVIDGMTGTAIQIVGNSGTITGFTIRGDSQAIQGAGSVTIDDNTFDEITITSAVPADVHLTAGTLVTITDNTFIDATPTDDQWAVSMSGPTQSVIEDNDFTGFRQALDINTGNTTIRGNTILGLHENAPFPGTGLVYSDGTALIEDNVIGPPTVGQTQGIQIIDSDSMTSPQTGATFRRNQIYDLDQGIGIVFTPAPVTLQGDLLAGNLIGLNSQADGLGNGGNVSATNVTLWDNGTDIEIFDADLAIDSTIVEDPINTYASTVACTITFSRGPTTTGNACQTFQTSAVPTFVNPAVNDYHMTTASPLIDIGQPLPPLPGTTDFDGDARVLDGNCDGMARRDIGADEVVRNCNPTPPPAAGDKDPPETTIIKKPGKRIESNKTTVKFTSNEPGSTFQCSLDKKPFSPCTPPRRLKKLAPGKHKFQVRAVDPAGNADPSPVGVKFTVAR